MKPTKHANIYQVYLLHFDEPIGKARHYVGICKAQRLHWRMLEHRNGRGAALTAKAYELGIGFSIACTWFTDDPAKEREIKVASNYAKHCPLCSRSPKLAGKRLGLKHYDPVEPRLPFKPIDIETGKRQSRYQK